MKLVLLVEDEPWLAEVYEQHFLAANFTVLRAGDAQEAIEILDTKKPHVIVLDMMLPNGNGVQLLHEMQSYVDLKDIPVIIYSSVANRLPKTLRAYGVTAILDKTTTRPRVLVERARELLVA